MNTRNRLLSVLKVYLVSFFCLAHGITIYGQRHVITSSAQLETRASSSYLTGLLPALSPPAPPPVEVPRRILQVHGPFEVSHLDLTKASTVVSLPSLPDASLVGASNRQTNQGGDAGESSGSQSPKATRKFDDIAGLNGIDPGIAVGGSYLLVCDNNHGIAVYNKTGTLIGPQPGQPGFANPFSVNSLFSKVKADITPHMNLPSGLPPNFAPGITGYGDLRVMFDSYRKRFWIYAASGNETATDLTTILNFPAVKLARRQKAAVAVSKTEDPRDGFYTYWWNESIHNGDCNDPDGCSDAVFKTSGEGADYPTIGISPKFFLATVGVNRRDPAFKTDTAEKAQQWIDCKTSFAAHGKSINWCGPFYVHLMVVDADRLASGFPHILQSPDTRSPPAARSYGLFIDASNYLTDRTEDGSDFATGMARGVRPVVMHGPQVETQFPSTVNSADAYFVNNFIDRSGKEPQGRVVLWSLVGDDLIPTQYIIRPFTVDGHNDWKFLLNSSYRDGKLYATFQECVVWKNIGGPCLWSIRALRINTLTSLTEIDRTFGVRNKLDEKPSARVNYKWPAIEANKDGDMVLGYVRSSTTETSLPQEVRFSVWYHDEPDLRPSRLLRAGEKDDATNTDTSGIAVDPSDDRSIWIAHIFAVEKNPPRRIVVGKVFDKKPPRPPISRRRP